jgi:hypothetical protein
MKMPLIAGLLCSLVPGSVYHLHNPITCCCSPCYLLQASHARKMLLRHLLRTIAISSYAPTGNVAATRPQDEDAALLYRSLKAMYARAAEFGGHLFSLAASVMTDLIHHEPQSYRLLAEAGLPQAFVEAIQAGVLPSSEAIVAIPNALVALCLNAAGLELVQSSCVLQVRGPGVSGAAVAVLLGVGSWHSLFPRCPGEPWAGPVQADAATRWAMNCNGSSCNCCP